MWLKYKEVQLFSEKYTFREFRKKKSIFKLLVINRPFGNVYNLNPCQASKNNDKRTENLLVNEGSMSD